MSGQTGKLIGKRIADRYCITGEIGRGGMGAVYKAIPFDDPSHSVAIKVIHRGGRLGYEDLMRFQKEAALMSRLHHPNIVVFHELGLFAADEEAEGGIGSGYYIVMEIADGTNLKESLERDGRKDLAFFFQVGLQVSKALDYTHGKNIVHRDIKPHNIIVGKAWRDQRGVTVKVLDFGVAGLAEAIHYTGAKEGNHKAFQEAAGTPLYMAPEQTVLMDAPVDHRVDLYSLGCVLYELLAGRPPFQASSREKLEKQHVFAEPEPLTNLRPDVPALIEKIVHKLLAKHPDDRYQTAFALHADLNRAKTMFEKAGRPAGISFPLGLKDQFQAVSAQLSLVGRDGEIETLVQGYDAVSAPKGRSRIALIRGTAGIGKSRLKAEFQAYLARRKVKFVSGSFSQHENALPFNALANAFNEYLYRVIRSHPHEAEELRRRFRNTLGPTAHMIASVVPGLKPFLSDIEEPTRDEEDDDILDSPEMFNKFAKAFSDFTRCLGTDNQPVVFLYDDLHWADDKSLDLIDQFFTNANTLQFYLVVTQRTDLHVENKRFDQFVEKFRRLRRRFMEIDLSPLEKQDVAQIVSNVLSSPDSVKPDLVEYLNDESRGNPMHLVELTRTLVSSDHIFPKTSEGGWDYDIEVLKRTKIRLNTIDLILSRIQDYQEFDRKVLGIAATVGLTFQFEVLLLEGRTQSVPLMKAVARAMDEGLVIRVSDDPDLKHLGKTFMFAHKKARDSIYESLDAAQRRQLHRAIGEKLEMAIPDPSEKTLFALAHHFNSAMDEKGTDDRDLAVRALRYNIEAGQAAKKSDSWQTAERYYENALRIMETWKDALSTLEERARVQEILADLISAQNNLKRAQYAYRQLLGLGLPIKRYAHIAYKAMSHQLMRGILSDTQKLIDGSLRHIRKAIPDRSITTLIQMWIGVLVDIWPGDKKRKRLHKVLALAHALRKHDPDEMAERFPLINIYRVGATLNMRRNKELAMVYQHHAVEQALRGRGSSDSLIRTVVDRCALMGYLGAHKMAYRFLDLSMEVARACRLRGAYGYAALMRVMTLDFIKDRHEDISANLKVARKYLSPTEDRLAFAQCLEFTLYRDLIRCNFRELYKNSRDIPRTMPTRNWMTPRAFAIILFSYLLQGSRDHVVGAGERFIKRRHIVQGREDDLFMRIVHTLVSFARGETRRTRESYILAMHDFIEGKADEFFFPYEDDFVALFALIFPVLFEQENGRALMPTKDMRLLLERLEKRIAKLKGPGRSVPLLLRARIGELLGKEKKVRHLYDDALRSSKVAGNHLVQTFGYLWFGLYLLDDGQAGRKDYIRRALVLAGKLKMKSVIEFIRKESERRSLKLQELDMMAMTTTTKVAGKHEGHVPSRLFVEHLNHICDSAESDTPLVEDLAESLTILRKYYSAKNVFCIVTAHEDGKSRVIFPEGGGHSHPGLLDYIEPYVNVRSTLYLPSNDAPWHLGEVEHPVTGSTHAAGKAAWAPQTSAAAALGNTTEDMESTVVVGDLNQSTAGLDHLPLDLSGTAAGMTAADVAAGLGSHNMAMNALIPLRTDFGSIGVLFVEEIEPRHSRDKAYSRGELDQFGSQLAIMLEKKTRDNLRSSTQESVVEAANAVYQPGTFTLESVNWLKLWSMGRLRTQRETSWYLGLSFGPDHYVLGFCMLTGDALVRERLASMLWHQFHVLRSLAVASGRRRIEAADLREELTGLLAAVPKASFLDGIALAYTVFNRQDGVATSGHFGPARPYVVGTENVVSPHNEVVMHFSNNRDLRYWEVAASLEDPHAYILSYDSSRLDKTEIKQSAYQSLIRASSEDDMHGQFAAMVGQDNLPRYYVAAIAGAAEFALSMPPPPPVAPPLVDEEEDQAS